MYVCSMLSRPPIYYDHIRLKNPNKYDLSFLKLLQNSLFKLCLRTMLWKMLKVIYTFYCFLIFYILVIMLDLFFVGYYYIISFSIAPFPPPFFHPPFPASFPVPSPLRCLFVTSFSLVQTTFVPLIVPVRQYWQQMLSCI